MPRPCAHEPRRLSPWLAFSFSPPSEGGFTQEQDVLSLLVSFLFLFFFPIKFSDISRTVLGWGSRGLEPTSSGFDGARAGAAAGGGGDTPPHPPQPAPRRSPPRGKSKQSKAGASAPGTELCATSGQEPFPRDQGAALGRKQKGRDPPPPSK